MNRKNDGCGMMAGQNEATEGRSRQLEALGSVESCLLAQAFWR